MSITTQAEITVHHSKETSQTWYHNFIQSTATKYWAAISRIFIGSVFLWAFLDKTFGLQFATAKDQDWSFATGNGDPTFGFLKFGTNPEGPFAGFFTGLRPGDTPDPGHWTNWLFMAGLLGIGVALILGVFMRIGSISGVVLLALMYLAEAPWANTIDPKTGQGAFNNPIMDEHVIYAAVLVMLMLFTAERTWGLGKWWQSTRLVQRFPFLA